MKQLMVIPAFVFCVTTAFSVAAAPVLIPGPSCPPGSVRGSEFIVFEDRNGDGQYDYAMAAFCDGRIEGANWNPSIGMGTPDDSLCTFVEKESATTVHILSYTSQGSFYSWNVTIKDTLTSYVYGGFGRDASGDSYCNAAVSSSIRRSHSTPSIFDVLKATEPGDVRTGQTGGAKGIE